MFTGSQPMVSLINTSAFILSIFSLFLNLFFYWVIWMTNQPWLVLSLCMYGIYFQVQKVGRYPVVNIIPVFFLYIFFTDWLLETNMMKSFVAILSNNIFYLLLLESFLTSMPLTKIPYFMICLFQGTLGLKVLAYERI